ncbi:MAG: M23 family metallopeptidase [Candidatus Cryptobacteroides sp.]
MRNYILNPETLLYEIKEVSLKSKILKGLLLFAGSVLLAIAYFWLVTAVAGVELPKTVFLKAQRSAWQTRVEAMNTRLDLLEGALDAFQVRDDDIYRSVYGMNEIPGQIRFAGLGGSEKYSYLEGIEPEGLLRNTLVRLDNITRRTCVQTQSFDEILSVSKEAGDMASCIPAVPPVIPDPSIYTLSSLFGYRTDPFDGTTRRHFGVDFAMKVGNPVFATGDGVVESVAFDFFGYGNCVVINHGFGFKTMYAHLNTIKVIEGMKVRRGDQIAESGKSGRSSGPHLHYEVIYRNTKVNPANYFDLSMPKEEYMRMITARAQESGQGTARHGFSIHRR